MVFTLIKILKNREVYRNVITAGALLPAVRCVSFLCHDLGYPLKRITKISDNISKILLAFKAEEVSTFNFSFHPSLNDFLGEIIEYTSGTFVTKDGYVNLKRDQSLFMDLLLNAKASEHGLMSALVLAQKIHSILSDSANFFREGKIGVEKFNLSVAISKMMILKAIGLHTCIRKKIVNLRVLEDFLLFIDFIEEFSRITRASLLGSRLPQFCDAKMKVSFNNSELTLEFSYIFDEKINRPEKLDPRITFVDKGKFLLERFGIKDPSFNLIIRVIDPINNQNGTQKQYIISYNSGNITINFDTNVDGKDNLIIDVKERNNLIKSEKEKLSKEIKYENVEILLKELYKDPQKANS